MTQKVSFLYLLGKHYCIGMEIPFALLHLWKVSFLNFKSDFFFYIFAKCIDCIKSNFLKIWKISKVTHLVSLNFRSSLPTYVIYIYTTHPSLRWGSNQICDHHPKLSGKSSIEPKKYLEAYGEVPDKEPPTL